MADQLNMNGLSLGGPGEQRSYIPPHMRGKMGTPGAAPSMNGTAAAMNGGINGSAWASPAA
jgi:ATP-dependent RNA helicase DDX3X